MDTLSPVIIYTPALLLYLAVGIYMLRLIQHRQSLQTSRLLVITAIAAAAHGVGLWYLMHGSQGIDLSIHHMLSLVMLVVNLLVLLTSIKKPLHNLFIFLLPVTAGAIILSMFSSGSQPHLIDVNPGVTLHILLSILSYSLLAIATLQALVWSWQNHQLKQHRMTTLTRLLPPLQTMELLMFELVWTGIVLLTAAIALGSLYIDNIFAQHLVHKTVLSLLAWIILVILLIGRYQAGWRGNTAVRWVFSGFLLLMLAYFGSKLVLEVILNN